MAAFSGPCEDLFLASSLRRGGHLFRRDKKAVEKALQAQRGSLTAELEDQPGADDLGGSAYTERLFALAIEVSQVADEVGSPAMTMQAWATVEYWAKRMIPYWDLPGIDMAIDGAYIGSNAETWTELDPAEFDRLAHIGIEAARKEGESDGGPATGFEILAGFMLRFTHTEENRIPAFDPFRDYIVGQPSYQRLDSGRRLMLIAARFDLPEEVTGEHIDIYERSHEIAWNMGLMTQILDGRGLLTS